MNGDIESIDFRHSDILERMILDLGRLLHETLTKANREDELTGLGELIGDFALLASAYSIKTGRLREDMGVGLNEAAILKLTAVKRGISPLSNEWHHYAEDTMRTIERLEAAIKHHKPS